MSKGRNERETDWKQISNSREQKRGGKGGSYGLNR